jgi:hypothetical protein
MIDAFCNFRFWPNVATRPESTRLSGIDPKRSVTQQI